MSLSALAAPLGAEPDRCYTGHVSVDVPSWFSDIALEVENMASVCSQADTISALETEEKSFFDDRAPQRVRWAGLEITDHPEKIQILKDSFQGFPISEIQKRATSCSTAECVFEHVIGTREAAIRALTIPPRTGYVVSFNQSADDGKHHPLSIWASDEVRILDQATMLAPPELLHLKSFKELRRGNYHVPDEAADAIDGSPRHPGYIIFLPETWSDGTHDILHELGHQYDYSHGYFHKSSGFSALPKKYVTDYASTSTWEDFADTISYYIYDPQTLRDLAPSKYQFVKTHVFHGKEFHTAPPVDLAALGDINVLADKVVECAAKTSIYTFSPAVVRSEEDSIFLSGLHVGNRNVCFLNPFQDLESSPEVLKACLDPRLQIAISRAEKSVMTDLYSQAMSSYVKLESQALSDKWKFERLQSEVRAAISNLGALKAFPDTKRQAIAAAVYSTVEKSVEMQTIRWRLHLN